MTVVTGGTGFIGAHLIEESWFAGGEAVRALVRRTTSFPAGVETVSLRSGASRVESMTRCAAPTRSSTSRRDQGASPSRLLPRQPSATVNLARAAAGKGLRFVHVSSLAAVGPRTPQWAAG